MNAFSRRKILEQTCLGFGSIVLADLLKGETATSAAVPVFSDLAARPGHFPAKAKAVIQLVQNGGPSQMDLFDPKPELTRRSGQPHPDGVEIHQPNNQNILFASPFEFRKYGQCGMDVSEALPQIANIVDDLCFVRSMHTEHNNHLEGLNMLLTCKIFAGRPVMGAWISYALGTENQNLPAYVVLRDPDGYTVGGKTLWANGYLPALYQGVEFSMRGAPVHHLNPPEPLPPGSQRASLDYLAKLNGAHVRDHPGESELDARIQNFELAARMQLAAGEVLDLSKETEATKKLYGLDNPAASSYGMRCLMARRLVEKGVRFVQVTVSPGQPWDHHNSIKQTLPKIATEVDQGSAALVKDLKSRGLLDSTIVMWGGEFGRLPTTQNGDGRDHNRNAFTIWFAGGGFKKGLVYGETDDFGYKAVVNRVGVPDMIATVLNQLGLDHKRVQYPYGGRMETPSDVTISGAKVVPALLSDPPKSELAAMRRRSFASALLFVSLLHAEAPRFEKDVLPIFKQYCFTCHGQSSPKLGLDLRSAASTLKGSYNGPVIVKGSPEQSLLFQKVSAHAMPPPVYGQKVPDSDIETMKLWIAGGAPADRQAGGKEAAEQRARFEKEILPILNARCVQCHGQGKPMAGLDLRTASSLLNGGASGPVVAEGLSEKSLLIRKVASHSMPPPGAGQPLSEAEIRVLREWIDRGNFGDGGEVENSADRPFSPAEAPEITAKQRDFWAFRKPVAAPVPKARAADRVRGPIDSFVLAKLESQGLSLSSAAPNLTLMRRAYFDLIGLPPTPEEIRTFVADTKPGAYERLIDRLLASPHYGERWGRQWLDAVGYVDTTGKDYDAKILELAEGMWLYRDYVVKSINDDKPWDRFLSEQIAGDEMVDWRSATHFTPQTVELLTATGYMRNILDITWDDIENLPTNRFEAIFKLVEKVSSSTLGLTVGCARCHSHKFDPIPQRDYYRFLSLFTTAYNPSDWITPKKRFLWAVSKPDKEEIDRYNAEIDRPVAELTKQLAAVRRPYEERLLNEKLKAVPEVIRTDVKAALETPKEKRDAVQKFLFTKFGANLKITPEDVSKSLNDADRAAVEKLETKIRTWNGYRRKAEKLVALWDVGAPPTNRLLQRGSEASPGPKVTPGFPEVLCDSGSTSAIRPKETQGKTSGIRLAFAQWLTSRENPLTARVIVNRIWQGHFGTGIVATPDNFGKMGAPPVNPELLDWLAVDFMEHGWSAKRLHKMIMLSSVYRQSSRQGSEPWMAKAKLIDPENRLLWRMNLRRLEAEVIRDSVIAAAGKLDPTMGGEPIELNARPDGLLVASAKDNPNAPWRRSIYLTARRNYFMNFLGVFDYPMIDTNCTRRTASATPLQSLTMMNDQFILDSAGYLASRAAEMAGSGAEPARKIEAAYMLALARKPTPAEIQMGEEYLQRQQEIYVKANETTTQAVAKSFNSLAQMLLSSNEFLYVD